MEILWWPVGTARTPVVALMRPIEDSDTGADAERKRDISESHTCNSANLQSCIYACLHSSTFAKSRTEITLRNPPGSRYFKSVRLHICDIAALKTHILA